MENKKAINFDSLNATDLLLLTDEIVLNKNIKDCTVPCFQVFYGIVTASIISQNFKEYQLKDLVALSKCVSCLKKHYKFDTLLFVQLLRKNLTNIPFEIAWWLHSNKIMPLMSYSSMTDSNTFSANLVRLLSLNKFECYFNLEKIVEDVISELIRGYYRLNVDIYNVTTNKLWSQFCLDVINSLVKLILNYVIENESSSVDIHLLLSFNKPRNSLPKLAIKRIYSQILGELLTHNEDNKYSLLSAYTYHRLWTADKICNNLRYVYEKIFNRVCGIRDIQTILNDHQGSINWKFALSAIGVCVARSANNPEDIKQVAVEYIDTSFKGGLTKVLLQGLLIMRHACLESRMQIDYLTWYRDMFGRSSNYCITNNPTFFKFFIDTLTKVIPYEPLEYINEQIECSIATPRGCIHMIHNYKSACRVRRQCLGESPNVLVKEIPITVLHLFEECTRMSQVSPVLKEIIRYQHNDFNQIVIPELLRKENKFKELTYLLVKHNVANKNIISKFDNKE